MQQCLLQTYEDPHVFTTVVALTFCKPIAFHMVHCLTRYTRIAIQRILHLLDGSLREQNICWVDRVGLRTACPTCTRMCSHQTTSRCCTCSSTHAMQACLQCMTSELW